MTMDVHRDLLRLLQRAGVRATGGLPDLVLVTEGGRSRPVRAKIYSHGRLGSATVRRAMRTNSSSVTVLFAAPEATDAVIADAARGAFDLVSVATETVVIGGAVLLNESGEPPRAVGRDRPFSWYRSAVQRVLAIADRPLTQREIADRVGATQQAISRILRSLDHVIRTDAGWIGDAELLDEWLRSYPGPRGLQGHWYGLGSPADQLLSARALLNELTAGSILTGELAADAYAPWMLPTTVRLYLDELIDFTDAGFSPSEAMDATMTVVVPEDPTIRAVAAHSAKPDRAWLLADPATVLWDLYNTSTDPTAVEAGDRLRRYIDAARAGRS